MQYCTTGANEEVRQRVHAALVVLNAVDRGDWPASYEILNGVGAILDAAERWALVAELAA